MTLTEESGRVIIDLRNEISMQVRGFQGYERLPEWIAQADENSRTTAEV